MEGNRNVLKRDVKRQLSRACAGGVPYVVKEFRRPRKWMPCLLRADRGSWVNSRRLAAAEIPLLRCLGWLRAADGRGFLLFEDGGDVTLERTMARRDLPAAERLRLLEAAVELLARLHGAGLVYGDFNPANIMIPAADGALRLVDYDHDTRRVRLTRRSRALLAEPRGLFELLYAYEPVFVELEPMLRGQKKYGPDVQRRTRWVGLGSGRLCRTERFTW